MGSCAWRNAVCHGGAGPRRRRLPGEDRHQGLGPDGACGDDDNASNTNVTVRFKAYGDKLYVKDGEADGRSAYGQFDSDYVDANGGDTKACRNPQLQQAPGRLATMQLSRHSAAIRVHAGQRGERSTWNAIQGLGLRPQQQLGGTACRA